jgi:hypothetical protein
MLASALTVVLTATCLAAPVHGDRVRAGPFVGGIVPRYDVVEGRFRLHVGGYRVPGSLSQKIPWFAPRGAHVSNFLVVVGRRLDRPGSFRQRFTRAYSPDTPEAVVFPSNLAPPRAGCWRLTFMSGRLVGSLTVLVSNRR